MIIEKENFNYNDERFADIQMLRYRLDGFEALSLEQKKYVYCLAQATLFGRDITFDQNGKYNLKIRKTLEAIYTSSDVDKTTDDFKKLTEYLKRVWFSNGIYHHYGCEKMMPDFTQQYFIDAVHSVSEKTLPLEKEETVDELCSTLIPVLFDDTVLAKRVNKTDGEDIVVTSACNFYDGVTQEEAESYYEAMKNADNTNEPISYGLNSRLVKRDGKLYEEVWNENSAYGNAISKIIFWLQEASSVAENDKQKSIISTLIEYYRTGDLHLFDEYSIEWVKALDGNIDFINGFIEVYGDPLGLTATWEGIVEYKDIEATKRTQKISSNAQWFEDHSPIDSRFRKPEVKGVSANVVCAAMLGGEEYPSTAIGINLPNADWIRAQHGSKSVTIGNLTDAYNKAAKGNGFIEEYVIDKSTIDMIKRYGDVCDDLHTDLHECLGHGSGRLLDGVNPDALKAYGNTIEEARADLFALYYLADEKLVELGLTENTEAYKSEYYTYIMNGLMTQLVRIKPGNVIEEAHMRNRALIAQWCITNGNGVVEMVKVNEKTYVKINDYDALRSLFATLLAEIQRIKSEGDYDAARNLVEIYAVRFDSELHQEVLSRYATLNIAPYKGFINPVMTPQKDNDGNIIDVTIDYSESYEHQMLRYSTDYATLI